jgi:hypothetical protein
MSIIRPINLLVQIVSSWDPPRHSINQNHSYQFLKAIDSADLLSTTVNLLCNSNFCGFTRSFIEKENDYSDDDPFIKLIVHPFKESNLGWLDDDEVIYGVCFTLDEEDNKKAKTIEILKPCKDFAIQNSSASKDNLIYTPTFQDKMGKFGQDNSQPISNATKVAPFDPTNPEAVKSTRFPPTYCPCKFIPLTPGMIAIIIYHEAT